MTEPEKTYSLPLPRAWYFTVDATVWTFYDDTFSGAVAQWVDVMMALGGDDWAPASDGSTRLQVAHNELSR